MFSAALGKNFLGSSGEEFSSPVTSRKQNHSMVLAVLPVSALAHSRLGGPSLDLLLVIRGWGGGEGGAFK